MTGLNVLGLSSRRIGDLALALHAEFVNGSWESPCPCHTAPEVLLQRTRSLRKVTEEEERSILATPHPKVRLTLLRDGRDRVVATCSAGCSIEDIAERVEVKLERFEPTFEDWLESVPVTTPRESLDAALAPVFDAAARAPLIAREAHGEKIAERFSLGRSVTRRLMRDAFRRQGLHPDPHDLTIIVTKGRQLVSVFEDARAAVVKANARHIAAGHVDRAGLSPLFVRGGVVCRLDVSQGQLPEVVPVTESVAFGYLARVATWTDATDNAVPPPKDAATDLLALPDHRLPEIDAVISTPVVDRRGELIAGAGYHPDAKVWFHGDLEVDVPETPTWHQVAQTRAFLYDNLFADFPFERRSDLAHAASALVLPFVRRMFDGPTPLHLFEAPKPGSGKSYLANAISVIATGEEVQARPVPREDDEIRKMLTAELARGKPIILLDNLGDKTVLDSASLASVLTSTRWTDRILGQSTMASLTNHAAWICTANNPRLSPELVRRCVRVRLDPGTEHPEDRTKFVHSDLIGWARQHRRELVSAILLLVRAWLQAGSPGPEKTLGSYTEWAAVVGGIVTFAGFPEFLHHRKEMAEGADVLTDDWRRFVRAWWGQNPIAREATPDATPQELQRLCADQGLLDLVLGDGNERSQFIRLGKALQKQIGQVLNVEIGGKEVPLRICRSAANDKGNRAYHLRVEGLSIRPSSEETQQFPASSRCPDVSEDIRENIREANQLEFPASSRCPDVDPSQARARASTHSHDAPTWKW